MRIITGDFTRGLEFQLPTERLKLSLSARLRDDDAAVRCDQTAKATMGDE
jgi:indolepyruvate ferredoxin oxidoreductase